MAKATRVITVANRKGGVGKSTVTVLLAAALGAEGKRVLVIDADEQRTVSTLADMERASYPDAVALVDVESVPPKFVLDVLRMKGEQYHVVFVDVPRITEDKTNTALGQLLALCDSVLIPSLGSQLDALATVDFITLVDEIAGFKLQHDVPFNVFGFINRINSRKDNEQAAAFLARAGLDIFDNGLPDLKLFTAPSIYFSPLAGAEGERRFGPFYREFRKRLKI